MLRIAFSVDDIAPAKGYGLDTITGPLKLLNMLNDEFGCKFNLFTIPIMEGKINITQFPEWCEWMKEQKHFKIEAHGITHVAMDPKFQAMELYGLNPEQVERLFKQSKDILNEAGFDPQIFKAPGWHFPNFAYKTVGKYFPILADHLMSTKTYEYSNGLKIVPYTLLAHKLHSTHYDDFIVIHCHINPAQGNKNGFTEELYLGLRNYLRNLEEQKNVEYVFMEDLV